jgi:hypothetical protein
MSDRIETLRGSIRSVAALGETAASSAGLSGRERKMRLSSGSIPPSRHAIQPTTDQEEDQALPT